MRVVFMGTPDFAAVILRALAEAHDVAAVVCQPDKPFGRKGVLTPPPVKKLAAAIGVPVLQPVKLKEPEFARGLREYRADIAVVAAYGRLLPPPVLRAFPLGCVNAHGSLLPKYRGASPIQTAIMEREKETGITIIQMNEEMDAGDIIHAAKAEIGRDETAGELFGRLAGIAAAAALEALSLISSRRAKPVKQDETAATYTKTLNRREGAVDWEKPARAAAGLINGFSPSPGAYAAIGGRTLKLLRACEGERTCAPPGRVISAGRKEGLSVAAGDGLSVRILEVQPAGGKAMKAGDYLNGAGIKPGDAFEAGEY
jgi:methionyl-tRNA formyltransferase